MAATDNFATFACGLDAPCWHAAAPDDNTDLSYTTRALFVGGAGNVNLVTAGGETVTFTGVTAGSVLPVRVARVKSTSTTATSIVALW